MSIIDKQAEPILSVEQGFQPPEFDLRYVTTEWQHFYSSNGIKNIDSLRFKIPTLSAPYCWDVTRMVLAAEIKLTNKKKEALKPDQLVSPINCFLPSLIKNLKISYNQTAVCTITEYPIVNYLNTRLNTNDLDSNSWLQTQCYVKETDFDNADVTNPGWVERRNYFGAFKKVNDVNTFYFAQNSTFLIGALNCYLPPCPITPCEIIIDMELSSPDYVFWAKDDAAKDVTYNFEDCRLMIPRIRQNDKLYMDTQLTLKHKPLRQYFDRVETYVYNISAGSRSEVIDSLSYGRQPGTTKA